MNRSWKNNPSGFVYFNTNSSYQNQDTSDYMSFNESPAYGSPKFNRFSPASYSSPVKFQKSPRNFQGRHPARNSFRYHSGRDSSNSFNNSDGSFNSPSFNNSKKKGGHHQHTKSNNSYSYGGKTDISRYLDHTSTKDPWAELEQKLKKTREAEIEKDSAVTDKEQVEESSSSSGNEEESESETKTSSSGAEDGTT